MGIDDRRKFKRAYVKIQVECRGKKFWQYVETKDLSAGGMFLATERLEEVNAKLEIMFEFEKNNEKKFVCAEGTVVWVRGRPVNDAQGNTLPPGMGIMFTKLNPSNAKEYIDSAIRSLEEKDNE